MTQISRGQNQPSFSVTLTKKDTHKPKAKVMKRFATKKTGKKARGLLPSILEKKGTEKKRKCRSEGLKK